MGSIKRKFGNNITSGKFDATDLTGTIPASNVANASLTSVTALPGISGDFIQTVASDPPAPDFGDVWYNSTEQKIKLKVQSIPSGTWASGGNLNNTGSGFQNHGAGTSIAGLAIGGYRPADANASVRVESYNGTSWTVVGSLTQALRNGGATGTSTAALSVTGTDNVGAFPTTTDTWNGTSWTDTAENNTGREAVTASGANSSSALVFAGQYAPGQVGFTESFNGTTWTEVNDMNTARNLPGGTGTQTATIAVGGYLPSSTYKANVELWDGSSWTETTDINTARGRGVSFGTSTSAIYSGGSYPSPAAAWANTEYWDGTSWTELNDLSTARGGGAGAGSNTSAILGGGATTSASTTATEEWEVPAGNQSIQGS